MKEHYLIDSVKRAWCEWFLHGDREIYQIALDYSSGYCAIHVSVECFLDIFADELLDESRHKREDLGAGCEKLTVFIPGHCVKVFCLKGSD